MDKKDIFKTICVVIGLYLLGGLIGYIIYKNTMKTTTTSTPVESIQIDSITKENTKLIIEVENLDSIKDAKVIEVKILDNDSTLRLFYQLIGK